MDDQLKSFLNEKAEYLEKERIKAVKKNYFYKIVKPLSKILKAVIIILLVINIIIPVLVPITIALGVIYFLFYFINDPKEVFEATLKEDILPKIFSYINTTYKYSSFGYNKKTLADSEIISKGFFANTVIIEGEDYVKGQIDNIDVEFVEIKFYRNETNYTKTAGGCLLSLILLPVEVFKNIFHGDTQSDDIFPGVVQDTNVFFSGLFMHADFHKDFSGKVVMLPKKNDRKIDQLYEILDPKNLTKINIENPHINDNYNIYTSDIQTGYYVLSQNLIDRIRIISEKENALPIVSFINGKMYFIIPWNKNFFRFNLNTKIENESFFLPYINEINYFEKIVKELNLDTRIWTKV